MRMRIGRMIASSALALGSAAAVPGCGGPPADDLPRQAVAGKVTLDGQPLAAGSIEFAPARAAEGTSATGTIAAGEFAISKAEGPVPGEYLVRINAAFDGAAGRSPAEALDAPEAAGKTTPAPVKNPVPAKYNVNTGLKAEIKAGAAEPLIFDLKSK